MRRFTARRVPGRRLNREIAREVGDSGHATPGSFRLAAQLVAEVRGGFVLGGGGHEREGIGGEEAWRPAIETATATASGTALQQILGVSRSRGVGWRGEFLAG